MDNREWGLFLVFTALIIVVSLGIGGVIGVTVSRDMQAIANPLSDNRFYEGVYATCLNGVMDGGIPFTQASQNCNKFVQDSADNNMESAGSPGYKPPR